MKKKTIIPIHRVLIGEIDEIPQIVETEYLRGLVNHVPFNSVVKEPITDEISLESEDLNNFTFNIINDEFPISDNEDSSNEKPSSALKNAQVKEQNFGSGSSSNIDFHTTFSKEDLRSRDAIAISTVLGEVSSQVVKYSRLKTILKTPGNTPKDQVNEFQLTLVELQQKVLKQVNQLQLNKEQWEKSFFVDNKYLPPDISDMNNDPYVADIAKRIKVGQALLNHWNIAF